MTAYSEVVTWDCTNEGPADPETWVQVRAPSMKVCGGTPNVVVSHETAVYRHTPNGLLWVLQKGTIVPDFGLQWAYTRRAGAGGATE